MVSPIPWVIDEQNLLHENASKGVAQMLAGSAKRKNIAVRMLLLNNVSDGNLELTSMQKIIELEAKNPKAHMKNTIYIVINAVKAQSVIVLGDNIPKSAALNESVSRIYSQIIIPALIAGNIENAVRESAVAMTTVLDTWPVMGQSSNQTFGKWLQENHFMMPLQILGGFLILFAVWIGLRRLFYRPHWETMDIDVEALEENMLLNSMMVRKGNDEYA